ncbi:MAG: hypothetical protein GY711_23390 [bacterium]|nr:hypothetical protein [bacterium]
MLRSKRLLAGATLSVMLFACESTSSSTARRQPVAERPTAPTYEPGGSEPTPSNGKPVSGICVQIGHTTTWTAPSVSTKLGAPAPQGDSRNDAYVGLRLKRTNERTEPDFARNVQGGNVGGEAASWASDIIVRLRVENADAQLGRDFQVFAASPARNAKTASLQPSSKDGREFDVRIPAGRPGAVAWVGFLAAPSKSPRTFHARIVDAWETAANRPVPVGWNDVARFVIEPHQRALRVQPTNDPRPTVVHFTGIQSVPHRPHISSEVVSEGGNEHRWTIELRRGNVESNPGSGQVGGERTRLSTPLDVVVAIDEKLTTAEYGTDFVLISGYGGKVLEPLRGSRSWRIRLPAGDTSAPVYLRFPDRRGQKEGWEQVVLEIVRVEPGRVGIGWNRKMRWLIEDSASGLDRP